MATTKKKPQGPKRDRARTEAALLDAAKTLFSKKGFDATTTKAVAQKAKVNEQLIQRYYGGKEGLLFAVMKGFKDSFVMRDSILDVRGDNLQEELENMMLKTLEMLHEQGEVVRVGISQAILNPKINKNVRRKIQNERIPGRMARTEEYKEKGWASRDLDSWAVTYGLMLLMFGIAFTGPYLHGIEREKLKLVAREMAKVLAKGMK
jgi:TetR/AcrR family transcriptional regulator, regulator of cefoperazone and chloramphenicol sensitivity